MPRCITQPDTHKLNMQRIVFPQSALLSEPRRRRSSASPLSGSAQERKAVRAASPSEHPKGMALTALRSVLHEKSLDGDNSIYGPGGIVMAQGDGMGGGESRWGTARRALIMRKAHNGFQGLILVPGDKNKRQPHEI